MIGQKEIQEKIAAQKKWNKDNEWPEFAPGDGICYRCHRQIYEAISLKRASTEGVTGCPYCFWSYCD